MKKKQITLDDLAVMVGKGFNEVSDRFNGVEGQLKSLDKRMTGLEQGQEEIKLRLDNVAYRFELRDLEKKFEKRLRTLELKAGIKY